MTSTLAHGTWWDLRKRVPVGELMEGRFTQLFPHAEAADYGDDALEVPRPRDDLAARDSPTPETEVDPEENSGIEAAYTYLGQFIDHDVTFDPTSQLRQPHHH